MSHTYEIECGQCTNKFCDCHPYWYFDEGEHEGETFCTKECILEYAKEYAIKDIMKNSITEETIKLTEQDLE